MQSSIVLASTLRESIDAMPSGGVVIGLVLGTLGFFWYLAKFAMYDTDESDPPGRKEVP